LPYFVDFWLNVLIFKSKQYYLLKVLIFQIQSEVTC